MGAVESLKEEHRAVRSLPIVESIAQDLLRISGLRRKAAAAVSAASALDG
jgi:hypothetical protein